MGNKVIEQTGLYCLTDFLIESSIDAGEIAQGDKSVSWDDHLYIYKSASNRKVEDLRYRIPVQVKSHKAKTIDVLEKEFITFNKLSKKHLRNYLEDNGVLLIRPVFFNKRNYSIYVKELLPIDIKELLKQNSVTPTIKLRKKSSSKAFLEFCDFFNDNRYLQPKVNVDLEISSDDLPKEFNVFADNREVRYSNPIKRDLSAAKFYWNKEDGQKLPLKDAKWVHSYKIEHKIILSGIPFYDFYFIYEDIEDYSIHIGDKVIIVNPKKSLFEISYTWENDKRSMNSRISGCMLIGCFALGNDLVLREGVISYNLFTIQERIKMVMDSYRHVNSLIRKNKQDFLSKGKQYVDNIRKYLAISKHFVDSQYNLLK